MKKSVFVLYAVICMTVVFSTNLFAADTLAVKKVTKLPAVIKVSPADVDISTALLDSNVEQDKKSVQRIKSLASISLTDNVNKIDSGIAKLKIKINECRNKSYTAQDQINAKCTDDMTVAACTYRLFRACIKEDKKWVETNISALNYNIKLVKDEVETILKTNVEIHKYLNGLNP